MYTHLHINCEGDAIGLVLGHVPRVGAVGCFGGDGHGTVALAVDEDEDVSVEFPGRFAHRRQPGQALGVIYEVSSNLSGEFPPGLGRPAWRCRWVEVGREGGWWMRKSSGEDGNWLVSPNLLVQQWVNFFSWSLSGSI